MREVELHKQNFNEFILETRGITFVYFWAPWCGPCKQIKPILAEVEKEFYGKATFLGIDIDKWPNVAIDCSISSVPHFAIYLNGEPKFMFSGTVSKKAMLQYLSKLV